MKRHITLHVVRRDVLLHALGGFAESRPMAARLWTSQEDEYLRQTYTVVRGCELWERLPRRTPGAIRRRACNLGLTRTKRRAAMVTDPQFMMRDGLRPTAFSGAAPLPSENAAPHSNFAQLQDAGEGGAPARNYVRLTKTASDLNFGT